MTEARQAVIAYLGQKGQATNRELTQALGRSPGTVHELLQRMVRDGQLRKAKLHYSIAPPAAPGAIRGLEYRLIFESDRFKIEERLNAEAEDGWRLVQAHLAPADYILVLSRGGAR